MTHCRRACNDERYSCSHLWRMPSVTVEKHYGNKDLRRYGESKFINNLRVLLKIPS